MVGFLSTKGVPEVRLNISDKTEANEVFWSCRSKCRKSPPLDIALHSARSETEDQPEQRRHNKQSGAKFGPRFCVKARRCPPLQTSSLDQAPILFSSLTEERKRREKNTVGLFDCRGRLAKLALVTFSVPCEKPALLRCWPEWHALDFFPRFLG